MRLVGLHGYADRRVIDTTQTLTSQIAEGWSHIRRAPQPVVDLHTVEYPPTFNAEASQPMTIVQFQDDHFEQNQRRRRSGGRHHHPAGTTEEGEAESPLDPPQIDSAGFRLLHKDAWIL